MSNAIITGQTGLLQTITYTGTGELSNTLTFNFLPKCIHAVGVNNVSGDVHNATIVAPASKMVVFNSASTNGKSNVTWSGNTVTLTSAESSWAVLNHSSITYSIIAFG